MEQVRTECPGLLALSLPPLRKALGAGCIAALHTFVGPAGLWSVVNSDPHPDPFGERARLPAPTSRQLLGGRFHFTSASAELLRLVHWAYADLPRHAFSARPPNFNVQLVLTDAASRGAPRQAGPELTFLGGAGLLSVVTGPSSFVTLAPEQGAALVAVSREMLKHPHHVRYELIEFAVFTLAARAQQLIPLHAACVSVHDRGVLLVGESGAGKSTMALHCLQRQLDFVSEDAVFVAAKGLHATGVANFLHIRPDALRWLTRREAGAIRASPSIRRRSGVQKFEIDLRRGDYRLAARPPRLRAVVFLSPRAGHKALLRPLSGADIRARLRAAQPYAVAQPHWNQFVSSMQDLGGYELRRARYPQEGAETLHELLVSGT
jgi:HPr Serine kinase C-terminal domain